MPFNLASIFRRGAAAAMIATSRPAAAATLPVRPAIVAAATSTPGRKVSGRLVAGSALAVLCCTTLTQFEGLKTSAYRDIVGIPTACVGETKGIRMGMTFWLTLACAVLGVVTAPPVPGTGAQALACVGAGAFWAGLLVTLRGLTWRP